MLLPARGCALARLAWPRPTWRQRGHIDGRIRGQWRRVATHPDLVKGTADTPCLGALYRKLVTSGVLQEDEHQLQAVQALAAVLEGINRQQHGRPPPPATAPRPLRAQAQGTAPTHPMADLAQGCLAGVQDWVAFLREGAADLWGSRGPAAEPGLRPYGAGAPVPAAPEAQCHGLYIYGEVGCGKTMLMDMFFHAVPVPQKRRLHLAMFMSEVYQRLHRLTDRTHPLSAAERLADEITAESWVLCFDEFQVTDIADAALLTTLFTLLFERGVVVVATSNKTPDTLYDMSAGFAAFVGLLKRRCVIHRLDRRQDYRLLGTVTHNTYFTPHNADTERRVYATFVRLTDHPVTKGAVLPHFGRTLVVPYAKGPCALFSFQYLCGDGTALGPNDYGALARAFHTICITDIPVLGLRNRQQSRRFISLVDELYRYKVKVVCSAASGPDGLFAFEELTEAATEERASEYAADSKTEREQGSSYFEHFEYTFGDEYSCEDKPYLRDAEAKDKRFTGKDEVFAFRRVQSRLREMMTDEYLRVQHLCFTTQEVNVDLLLSSTRRLEA